MIFESQQFSGGGRLTPFIPRVLLGAVVFFLVSLLPQHRQCLTGLSQKQNTVTRFKTHASVHISKVSFQYCKKDVKPIFTLYRNKMNVCPKMLVLDRFSSRWKLMEQG